MCWQPVRKTSFIDISHSQITDSRNIVIQGWRPSIVRPPRSPDAMVPERPPQCGSSDHYSGLWYSHWGPCLHCTNMSAGEYRVSMQPREYWSGTYIRGAEHTTLTVDTSTPDFCVSNFGHIQASPMFEYKNIYGQIAMAESQCSSVFVVANRLTCNDQSR